MGNGLNFRMFSLRKPTLWFGVSVRFEYDLTDKCVNKRIANFRLWSVVYDKNGEIEEITKEHYELTIFLHEKGTETNWFKDEIKKIASLLEDVDFSKFDTLDIEYQSNSGYELVTTKCGSVENFKKICNQYLKAWIDEDELAQTCTPEMEPTGLLP